MAEGGMMAELLVATVMVVLTVAIHGAGLVGLVRLLRIELRYEAKGHIHPTSLRAYSSIMALVMGLVTLHGAEIWLYAALYYAIDAIAVFRDALYYSTHTYAAVGFGDALIHPNWRLLGAIEGINGVILLGWSTAFFVSVVARLNRR